MHHHLCPVLPRVPAAVTSEAFDELAVLTETKWKFSTFLLNRSDHFLERTFMTFLLFRVATRLQS